MSSIVYFNLKHALNEQRKIINLSGGSHGCRDKEQLKATLDFIKNDDYYNTFSEKISYLLYSISKNHAFVDGNKRTAIALASYLMEINGYGERVGNFIVQMESIIVWVVEDKINRSLLLRIVNDLIVSGEIQEEIQMEMLTVIS